MIQSPPKTIIEVFESLPEGTLCQIINNRLLMTPAPGFWHQDTVSEIAMQIRGFVNKNGLGKVVVSPVDVYLNENNVYQPDILFIATERMHIVQNGKVKGASDLVIEVLSPGTEHVDKKSKKLVYEKSGIKEYWIVNPVSKAVQGYQLTNNHFEQLAPATGGIVSRLLSTKFVF